MTNISCAQGTAKEPTSFSKNAEGKYPVTGTIEKYDEGLDKIITPGAQAEKLAEGFIWSEGPVWAPAIHSLLFSDVPSNAIYSWNEKEGIKLWLKPSGFSGEGFYSREPGSNGLLLDAKGRLVLCQHGNRQMARMATPVEKPSAQFEVLANTYNGKKFNSPNDAAYDDKGDLYFTDPPYGLAKQMQDSSKELAWQGVYKVNRDGKVVLLLDSLTRPNGISFFPGYKSLLVANSDPAKAI
jgi:gluconolactonase